MDNIYLEQNVFINKEPTNDFKTLNDIDKKDFNANKLCLYNEKHVECISGGELKTLLELPDFRKYEVCINDACIDYESVQILKGSKDIELKSNNKQDGFKDMCIGYQNLPAHQCKGPDSSLDYNFELQSLVPKPCNNYNYIDSEVPIPIPDTYFKLKASRDLSDINSLLINKFKFANFGDDIPEVAPKSLHTSDIDEFIRPME